MQEQNTEQIDGLETTNNQGFDALNTYEGAKSELFLKALHCGDTAQCLLLLKKKEVAILDTSTITDWETITKNYKNAYRQLNLNEQAMKDEIAAQQEQLKAVMQPLAAMRPALLKAISYFEGDGIESGEKEDFKWRMAKKLTKPAVRAILDNMAEKKKGLTKAEKEARGKQAEMYTNVLFSFVQFCKDNGTDLEQVIKNVDLVPAYAVIRHYELISDGDVNRIQGFVNEKVKSIAPATTEQIGNANPEPV